MSQYSDLSIPVTAEEVTTAAQDTDGDGDGFAAIFLHALETDLDRIEEEVADQLKSGHATADDMKEALFVLKLRQMRDRVRKTTYGVAMAEAGQ